MYQRMHVFIVNAHIWFFLDAFYLNLVLEHLADGATH